jgi:hypothetical protein
MLCILSTTKLDQKIDRYYNSINHPSVFDIGYYYLPNLSKYEIIGHVYSLIFIAILLRLPKLWEDFLGYIIPILFIRLLFIHMTVLPKHRTCNINQQMYFLGGCYDKIFSGHFSVLLLITLLLLKYKYITLPWVIGINLIHLLLLLLFRWHYTIDMIIACMVTLIVVQNDINVIKILS